MTDTDVIVFCEACSLPMVGTSCTDARGLRWGSEPGLDSPVDWPCHDCETPPGGYHHRGCCVAWCPDCNDQLLGCDGHPPAA